MPLKTCAVICNVFEHTGLPMVGASVSATLDRFEVYEGYVVPQVVSSTTDVNGHATLNLWPNELGATASTYIIKILGTNGKKITTTAVVPDQITMPLHLIAKLPPYDGKVDGQIMLQAAIDAGVTAIAKASEANQSAQAAAQSALLATTGDNAILRNARYTRDSNGVLTRIDYDGGLYKTYAYADGLVTHRDFFNGLNTTRKAFVRVDGIIVATPEETI